MRFLSAVIFAIGARATDLQVRQMVYLVCKERTAVAEMILAGVIHEMVKKELAEALERSSGLTLPLGAAKT